MPDFWSTRAPPRWAMSSSKWATPTGRAFPRAPSTSCICGFVASTAGAPERLLAEARRLARPGGVIALQEPDGSSLNCYPPHPAWDSLKAAFLGAFRGVGADLELARRLYHVVRQAGLADVQFRPFILGVRATDPTVDYLPSIVESLQG